ncbi:X-linked interleukin-1 receptor accessory protein-like 2 [Cylas formicarius]|uniref:X-linked interleukin-1 receptor accessory protein-like 2 n=1 Tax=Cylas formicarius TaxID=197179 RepID=UPI0029584021|nr:X-linked interleukin-1 receptor accessory protein-like 2 [Cylas formicarius]
MGLSSRALIWYFLVGAAIAIEDYCSLNVYNNNGNEMQFTKEATNEEFAIVGKFKELHCCAKGYRSIEWYKDGKIYPWELSLSRMVLFPESANQTIYTQIVTEDDAGNYTCVLRNDTVVHAHTINLKVFEKLPDDPKITYISQDKEIVLGESMRLFCEAFAGRIDLPDAHNEAVWRKQLVNGSLLEVPDRLQQEKITREDGQTFGTYLVFPAVHEQDYGTYTCVITKPGNTIQKRVSVTEKVKVVEYVDPNPPPIKEILFFSAALALLLTAAFILHRQFSLKFQIWLKDSFGPSEENDGNINDVLVVFAPKDAELALGVLIPNLESRFGYKCLYKEFSTDISNWSLELARDSESSRRIISVISPAAVNETWASSNLYQALKQLQTIGQSKLICVALKELPASKNETKNSVGETLSSLTRSMNLILWERSKDSKFWLNLRKHLPPKRRLDNVSTELVQQTGDNQSRLNSKPSECSLDSLMV